MLIDLTSKIYFHIVVNLRCIKAIQVMFAEAMADASKLGKEVDISYYTDAAAEAALQYINMGGEYLGSISSGEYKHTSINAKIDLRSPKIFIPEIIDEE